MANLFATLNTASHTLQALERMMTVSQNNVSNASTPGFARQDAVALALPFDNNGLVGGVTTGTPQNSRDQFAEQSVRNEVANDGLYSQLAASLAPLDGVIDITGASGLSGGLTKLLQSFSAWSANPTSSTAQQAVISAAQTFAAGARQTSNQLDQVRNGLASNLASTVNQINQLAGKIQDYNKAKLSGTAPDPGLDAGLYSNLESLSQLGNFVPLFQADGTVTVLLGGQSPLVIGTETNPISVAYNGSPSPANPGAQPAAHIVDAGGADITSLVGQGKLGALLRVRNTDLPALTGDQNQTGSLNTLVKQVADRVNQLLTSGQTTGLTPQSGTALFTYSTTNATDVIRSLAVNPSITPAQLAPADPGPPASSNGIALKLASLGQSTDPADQISGTSILGYLGGIASGIGQKISDAQTGRQRSTDLVVQAKALRTQLSGVSLDQEAIHLVELQRSYQAAARVVTIVNEMAQTLLQM